MLVLFTAVSAFTWRRAGAAQSTAVTNAEVDLAATPGFRRLSKEEKKTAKQEAKAGDLPGKAERQATRGVQNSRDFASREANDYEHGNSRDYASRESNDYEHGTSRDYATVLCPGQDEGNYCDCEGDCTEYPSWCSCGEAKTCCSNAGMSRANNDYERGTSRDYASREANDYEGGTSRDYASREANDYEGGTSRDYGSHEEYNYDERKYDEHGTGRDFTSEEEVDAENRAEDYAHESEEGDELPECIMDCHLAFDFDDARSVCDALTGWETTACTEDCDDETHEAIAHYRGEACAGNWPADSPEHTSYDSYDNDAEFEVELAEQGHENASNCVQNCVDPCWHPTWQTCWDGLWQNCWDAEWEACWATGAGQEGCHQQCLDTCQESTMADCQTATEETCTPKCLAECGLTHEDPSFEEGSREFEASNEGSY